MRRLPAGPPPASPAAALRGRSHPSRALLDRVLAGEETAARDLQREYDAQAQEWSAWCASNADYLLPLHDALRRALPGPPARALEVGCGTGQASAVLAERAGALVCTDVSLEMLRQLPSGLRPRAVASDVRRLPFPTASLDLVVGLNAVPALQEFWRVLAPGGTCLWVSSFGDDTPLYVPPEQLAAGWDGPVVTAVAGHGEWVALSRGAAR